MKIDKISLLYKTPEERREFYRSVGPEWEHALLYDEDFSKIYPGIEDELFKDAIDVHPHVYPDFTTRSDDIISYAIEASKLGMRAICLKDHWFPSMTLAWAVEQHLKYLVSKGELPRAVRVFGDITLNWQINPEMVKHALRYPNIKMIRMPSLNARGPRKMNPKGLTIFNERDEIIPEVKEILELSVQAKVGVCSGHLSSEENIALARLAKDCGARLILNHPLWMSLDELKECAKEGAYIGAYVHMFLPDIYGPGKDPLTTLSVIRQVGPEHVIIASDSSQLLNPKPIEGLRLMLRAMLGFHFTKEEIEIMFKRNPAKLLWLE
ncbi:MAG: DUF6282 family protein [Candidatus Bathyarchaeia archaeon]